jgi:hypothetical protein
MPFFPLLSTYGSVLCTLRITRRIHSILGGLGRVSEGFSKEFRLDLSVLTIVAREIGRVLTPRDSLEAFFERLEILRAGKRLMVDVPYRFFPELPRLRGEPTCLVIPPLKRSRLVHRGIP